MRRYKPNIATFIKYYHLKATFYTDTLYVKVPSLVGNKLSKLFTSGDSIFLTPMKSKADGVIGLMDICDKHNIIEELRYDIAKEESIPGTMMQKIMREFCIIGRSSDPYT